MTIAVNRRSLLIGGTVMGLAAGQPVLAAGPSTPGPATPIRAVPVPMNRVRLKPSIFADAQQANRTYLVSLSPDRLLHRFHKGAGLAPKGDLYGGWEAQSISGHTLGHYLSACALIVANTGDSVLRERLAYTVAELARIQAADGDGYVGGSTTWGQTDIVDGKQVFEELRRGSVRADAFGVNDGWVPLYTLHKVHAGLIAAHQLAATPGALDVVRRLSGYFATIVEGLSDDELQRLLACEHGGINESFAELHAITGEPRWLTLATRLRHRVVIEPLADGHDALAGLHANTQIPKLVGLARLYELAGAPRDAAAARFFHQTVRDRHSYVIGGNSDREHFGPPGQIASNLSETTCEACNSYNMMRLTRHLYAWQPDANWFDYYERVQLNHIMAQQRPDTGQFVYFMPMAAGGRRSYSTPTDSFWCCVGSGMESHAKHSDSIYWRAGDTLFVNLFIASSLAEVDGFTLDLDTAYPQGETVRLAIKTPPRRLAAIALRLPGWCDTPEVSLNGSKVPFERRNGYAELRRRWKTGDVVELKLPASLRAEPAPDRPDLVAFLSGPLVLSADMGPSDKPFEATGPALIADADPTSTMQPARQRWHRYTATAAQGGTLELSPFFSQYDRRTAVYVPIFSPARWSREGQSYLDVEAKRIDLARRTVDKVFLGEQQPEVDHRVEPGATERVQLNGRSGRRIRVGSTMAMRLARRPGPLLLRLTFWGEDKGGTVNLFVNDAKVATLRTPDLRKPGFVSTDVPLPASAADLLPEALLVRVTGTGGQTVLYDVGVMAADRAATAPHPMSAT